MGTVRYTIDNWQFLQKERVMSRARILACLMILLLVGLSCDIPDQTVETVAVITSPSLAGIDMPKDGDIIPLAPYEFVYHGSDLAEVAQMELAINGVPITIQANPSPGTGFVVLRYLWTPPAAGTYLIQARAQNQYGEWGPYTYITITVEPSHDSVLVNPLSTAEPTRKIVTPIPTQTMPSLNLGSDGLFASIVRSDDWFYFGAGSCQPREVDFAVTIYKFYVIDYVFMFVRLDDKDGSGMTFWNDGKPMKETSSGKYITTIVLSDIPGSESFDNAWLWYQFVIQKSDGGYIRSKVYTDISLYRCR